MGQEEGLGRRGGLGGGAERGAQGECRQGGGRSRARWERSVSKGVGGGVGGRRGTLKSDRPRMSLNDTYCTPSSATCTLHDGAHRTSHSESSSDSHRTSCRCGACEEGGGGGRAGREEGRALGQWQRARLATAKSGGTGRGSWCRAGERGWGGGEGGGRGGRAGGGGAPRLGRMGRSTPRSAPCLSARPT